MLYLFIWPYQTASTFGSVNPFFVGASVMKDLWDGALDTPMPLVSTVIISIWAFALAYYALSRKEVSE
jgi:hypothetical protein